MSRERDWCALDLVYAESLHDWLCERPPPEDVPSCADLSRDRERDRVEARDDERARYGDG